MFEHSKSCVKAHKRYEAELAAFEVAHPNYCRKCYGWGYFVYNYDPSPPGISLGSGYMTEIDLCPRCTEKDLCPWCGEKLTVDDKDWTYGDGYPSEYVRCSCGYGPDNDGGIPEGPECYCWEEDYDDWRANK